MLPLGLPEPLLSGPAPRLRAIPASAPFLEVLADAMASALWRKDDPFALADALVLLPSRRAARGLIDAFAKRLGGAALLPTIRPLGDPYADEDPDVWGADPIAADLPPPIEPLHRRFQLAALIRRREKIEHGVEDPAGALALADALARLLDSAATVDSVAWEKLPTLVEDIDLARHWASSAEFLRIITTYWPLLLEERGLSDPAEHGAALRRALAAQWEQTPPRRPIIIAGSTGSQSATRALMRVVARLPRGAVVFPGLDTDVDDASWRLVGEQHPQHALKGTLVALGVERQAIPALALESASGRARRALMREALAPAEKTADWLARLEAAGGAQLVREGAGGIRLLEAATEDEEATAIALMLRETLEHGSMTAAVVTPDAALARRIEAKLTRWGVEPLVSHGRPLLHTEAGRLIALLCELALDESEPVALAALLKHPRVALATGRALTALEHKGFRGPRRHQSLAELHALESLAKEGDARALVHGVLEALAPLCGLMSRREISLEGFVDALAETGERLTGGAIWNGRDGEVAANILREVGEHGAALGSIEARAAPRVLLHLMEAREVAPEPSSGEARVAILGVLEARLQRRDLMILAGLNEGVWPTPAGEDPFLSRAMRQSLGLPSLDERIGLAAHDFAQMASAPKVVFTRALRREGSPTLASRWLWRLLTFAKGAGVSFESCAETLDWARSLDHVEVVTPVRPPRPRPPAGKRLKQISVTAVETLIRDPYAIYARRILKLEHIAPIGAPAGPAERGIAVHAAIERFGDGDNAAELLRLLDEEFRRNGVPAERRAAEEARLRASANALIAWFAERRARNATVFREAYGKLDLGEVSLTGIADRIEIRPGHAAILDFKTGQPPSDKQVETGLAPQLLLEAAMLARGAFEGLPKAKVEELIYWRVGNAEPTPHEVVLKGTPHEAGESALASLKHLLARYAEGDQAFLSKPRVQFIRPYAEYDHLARRKEWADAEGGEA